MANIQLNFNDYYQSIYQGRWEALSSALREPERQVKRWNTLLQDDFTNFDSISIDSPNTDSSNCKVLKNNSTNSIESIEWLPYCEWNKDGSVIPRNENQLLTYYVLDPSSVLVAENLNVKPGEKVLDLCAAPGGKSLILAQRLFAKEHSESELILNELSPDRRARLTKVIQQYVPMAIRQQIWVRGKDGNRFGLEVKNYFDAILLDAPCSGERHLLQNPKELGAWKVQRTKGLAQKQYSLLCSAWLSLKPGGRLMYSTCSISPLENEGVIEKFIHKKMGVQSLSIRLKADAVEELKYGVIYLPDRSGFGPMYSCLLQKLT